MDQNFAKLLIEDYPLQVLPKLAKIIGLNEAIFVQQLHYWTKGKNAKEKDGRFWVYNTYDEWLAQFCFWSIATLRRTIRSCERQRVILVDNFNQKGFDKTRWYSVNYDVVNRLNSSCDQNDQIDVIKMNSPCDQNDQIDVIKMIRPIPETTQRLHRDYTETTNREPLSSDDDGIPYAAIIAYLNQATGKEFNYTTEAHRRKIRARWREGHRLEDFKRVIDVKVRQWGNHPKMMRYLRPDTLFNTKFESYLNERVRCAADDDYKNLDF